MAFESKIISAESKINFLIKELGWNLQNFRAESTAGMGTSTAKNQEECTTTAEENVQGNLEFSLGNQLDLSINSDNGPSVVLTPEIQDAVLQSEVKGRPVPSSSNQLTGTFTPEERLKLYNYVIENTPRQEVAANHNHIVLPDDVQIDKKKEGDVEMTPLQLAAAERDAKRRRPTYKNVHTNRKTHTEVIREVIESQMTATFQMEDEVRHRLSAEPRRESSCRSDERDRHRHRDRRREDDHRYKSSKRYADDWRHSEEGGKRRRRESNEDGRLFHDAGSAEGFRIQDGGNLLYKNSHGEMEQSRRRSSERDLSLEKSRNKKSKKEKKRKKEKKHKKKKRRKSSSGSSGSSS